MCISIKRAIAFVRHFYLRINKLKNIIILEYNFKYFRKYMNLSRLRIMVLHRIANPGPSGLAGSIPAGGVHAIAKISFFQ